MLPSGKFLGQFSRHVVNVFALLLLVLVGTVFITTPASLLSIVTNGALTTGVFAAIIIVYYFLSTILPIDKIIGRVYPFFGAILLFGSLGVGIALLFSDYTIPELTLKNLHPENLPIFPISFLLFFYGSFYL